MPRNSQQACFIFEEVFITSLKLIGFSEFRDCLSDDSDRVVKRAT